MYVSNATVHSSNGIKSFSTQTIKTICLVIAHTFVYIPFVETTKIRIDLLVQKSGCSNFFADSAKYVSNATVHSSNEIKPFY